MTRANRQRIGLVLAGLGDANVNALRFLVLRMNALQQTFEFEFLPSCDDPFLNLLKSFESRTPPLPLDRKGVRNQAAAFAARYRAHLEIEIAGYELAEGVPDYFIVLSLARMSDGYYSARQWPVSVIGLGDWKTKMAPPSILEFILTLVLREGVASISRRLRGSQHLGTKGCLCDFTASLDEVRMKVLNAYVCAHCENAMVSDGYEHLASELRELLSKRWLGRIDDTESPAAISAQLGYNLFVTRGLSPTWRERTLAVLQEEGAKEAVKLVFSIVGGALLLWLGIKAAT